MSESEHPAIIEEDRPSWWRPPRGYSWRQFEPGHTLSIRHGAFSPRTWSPISESLVAGVLGDFPDLARHPELLRAWADAEARAELLRRHLDEVGMMDPEGNPRTGPLKWLTTFDNAAQRYRDQLGLTPRSEAELARLRADAIHAAASVEDAAQTGAAVLAHRRAGLSVVADDDGPEDAA